VGTGNQALRARVRSQKLIRLPKRLENYLFSAGRAEGWFELGGRRVLRDGRAGGINCRGGRQEEAQLDRDPASQHDYRRRGEYGVRSHGHAPHCPKTQTRPNDLECRPSCPNRKGRSATKDWPPCFANGMIAS
jgi:hypothetical protein